MEKKDNLEYRKCTENKPFPVSISTANLERPKSGSYHKIYLYRQIEEESSFSLAEMEMEVQKFRVDNTYFI